MGQTEKSGRTTRKSASPLTPDIVNVGGHVSKVPEAVVNDRASVSIYFNEKQTYTKARSDRIGPGVALPLCGASSSALRMVGLLHQKQRIADC
jgi:hypothetical protein